eukprot:scaffold480664_cov33-Prasinocladus_malaysianus.AAC.1
MSPSDRRVFGYLASQIINFGNEEGRTIDRPSACIPTELIEYTTDGKLSLTCAPQTVFESIKIVDINGKNKQFFSKRSPDQPADPKSSVDLVWIWSSRTQAPSRKTTQWSTGYNGALIRESRDRVRIPWGWISRLGAFRSLDRVGSEGGHHGPCNCWAKVWRALLAMLRVLTSRARKKPLAR